MFKLLAIIVLILANLNILCDGMKQNSKSASSSQGPTKQLPSSPKASSSQPNLESPPTNAELKAFRKRIASFYEALKPQYSWRPADRCGIPVKSSEIVLKQAINTFFQLRQKTPPLYLKNRSLNIIVDKKTNIDDNGQLTKRWFTLVSTQMKNPKFGLFQYCNVPPGYSKRTQIIPNGTRKLSEYTSMGVIVGLAIYHRCLLNVTFSTPFLKSILGEQIKLAETKTADFQFYEESLKIQKKDSRNDYQIQIKISKKFVGAVELEMEAFKEGLTSVIPTELLKIFNDRELGWLISGFEIIDLEDWKRNTRSEYCEETRLQIKLFWQAMENLTNAQRAEVLQLATGSPRAPAAGFVQLNEGFFGYKGLSFSFALNVTRDATDTPNVDTVERSIQLRWSKDVQEMEDQLKILIQKSSEIYDSELWK